ncbi:MAG: MBL fold metallo-hydrolase [Planctomycetota bacterium]
MKSRNDRSGSNTQSRPAAATPPECVPSSNDTTQTTAFSYDTLRLSPMATLTFCGAAGTVTGSCSLIDCDNGKFLVDCGLFQGNRTTQDLNYQPFPFEPAGVGFLLLTHAHIDHSGLLPKLTRSGFQGKIHCTEATKDLLEFMLRDSAFIQESNTERLNSKRERRGQPPLEPLYTVADAEATLQQLVATDYETWFEPADGILCRFWNAGHLLGSASIEVHFDQSGKTVNMLFSGDLGPDEKAFHPEPDAPTDYDYIICESTYGDRDRDDYTLEKRREAIRDELVRGLSRGGNVVIPSFAVERSQELLHDIAVLLNKGEIPDATVFLDSPLASKATEVFIKYASEMEDIAVNESELFRHPNFQLVESVEESKAINRVKRNAIIISASGMCTAGRIKHHLKNNIFRKESTILFVGYQSPGTLGDIILRGVPRVRIHGKQYEVRAEIRKLGHYSAHADQGELIDWIIERGPARGGLFLNHGEQQARETLREILVQRGIDGSKILLPAFDDRYTLVAGSPATALEKQPPRIDPTELERDWHNDYAEFILDLGETLRATESSKQRRALIQKLATALTES